MRISSKKISAPRLDRSSAKSVTALLRMASPVAMGNQRQMRRMDMLWPAFALIATGYSEGAGSGKL
jgi:hypothetical protein